MRRLDAKALYDAMDRQRRSRELSWKQVATQIGVSESTLRRARAGGRMEVDGVLAMVTWLGESVEAFVRESRS